MLPAGGEHPQVGVVEVAAEPPVDVPALGGEQGMHPLGSARSAAGSSPARKRLTTSTPALYAAEVVADLTGEPSAVEIILMRSLTGLAALSALAVLATGCSAFSGTGSASGSGGPTVVAAFYPLAWLTERVADGTGAESIC